MARLNAGPAHPGTAQPWRVRAILICGCHPVCGLRVCGLPSLCLFELRGQALVHRVSDARAQLGGGTQRLWQRLPIRGTAAGAWALGLEALAGPGASPPTACPFSPGSGATPVWPGCQSHSPKLVLSPCSAQTGRGVIPPVAAAAAAGRLSLGAAAAPDGPPGCQGQRALPVSTCPRSCRPELGEGGARRPRREAGCRADDGSGPVGSLPPGPALPAG